MPTREEKNTISNLYRLRSLEELEYDPKYQSHNNNRQSVFITKTIMEIVEDTQPPVDLWHGLWHQGEMGMQAANHWPHRALRGPSCHEYRRHRRGSCRSAA